MILNKGDWVKSASGTVGDVTLVDGSEVYVRTLDGLTSVFPIDTLTKVDPPVLLDPLEEDPRD
jgi:hypothetical protein